MIEHLDIPLFMPLAIQLQDYCTGMLLPWSYNGISGCLYRDNCCVALVTVFVACLSQHSVRAFTMQFLIVYSVGCDADPLVIGGCVLLGRFCVCL